MALPRRSLVEVRFPHPHSASRDTGAWQAAIGTPDELKPQKWLLKFMAAEIDCVAVTDHNTGEWIDLLKAAYAQMKREADAGTPPDGFRELHLFPGVGDLGARWLSSASDLRPLCQQSNHQRPVGAGGLPSVRAATVIVSPESVQPKWLSAF